MIIISITNPDLPNTVFPDAVDEFTMKRDPSKIDIPFINEYKAKYLSGDIEGAAIILEAHGLKEAQVSAADFNKLSNAITASERWYKTQFEQYLANNTKQTITSAAQPAKQLLGDIWNQIV